MAAAVAGAVISGVAMYAVGTRAQDNGFAEMPAYVQTLDGQVVPVNQPIAYSNQLRPVAQPVLVQQQAAPAPVRRTVTRRTQPVQERVVVREEIEERDENERSWGKTAMIIGGSTATGAAVGGIVDGKKGALIGAAIGGGAASIYEATRRR